MSLYQKFMNYFFQWQFVLLHNIDGHTQLKRARPLGNFWYAAPYLDYTRIKLLPLGKVYGQGYIKEWAPVTEFMFKIYEEKPHAST